MAENVPFEDLRERLQERFGRGVAEAWAEEDFDALAHEAFALQFEHIPPFRAFCEARGRTPDAVGTWSEIPAVPARAFKEIDFAVAEPEAVFLTSGTTAGAARRGRHLVPSTSLYQASLLPPFRRYVMGPTSRMTFLSLIPAPDALPSSSLSFMVGAAAAALATEAHWVVDGAGTLDAVGLRSAMEEAARSGEPVLVLGTALALLHAVERLEAEPTAPLPSGSRVMETGGFKGLDRDIGRDELYRLITAATGVPAERIVSEYGMTELLSQLYTPVLVEGREDGRGHVPPPWLRIRALDPSSLEEMEPGRQGLLAFFDLANAGSVCHVLTEDVGAVVDGRVHLRGRVAGAEPRGCSRAMDELMSAARTAP